MSTRRCPRGPGLLALVLALGLVAAPAARAVGNSPPIPNPVLEARYQHLIEEVRCLQCQDLNIANSSAPLAASMRQVIRRLLYAGKTNRAIKRYLVARYGDFVLFKPPVDSETMALWWGPYVLLALGCLVLVAVLVRQARRYRATPPPGGGTP